MGKRLRRRVGVERGRHRKEERLKRLTGRRMGKRESRRREAGKGEK